MTTAGVIGLGVIGSGVAICLARAGLLTAVYDVREEATGALLADIEKESANPPLIVTTPRELAQKCDVILIAVVDAAQTLAVLHGPDGIIAAARRVHVVLLATVSLQDLAQIQSVADAAGVSLIDCGVTGGPAARRNGLVCLVGAEDRQLAAVMPVLNGFAKSVAHMGGPGKGMAAKIARNVVVYGSMRAGYEGVALARAAGVDVRQLIRVIEESAESVGGPMALMARPANPLTDPDEAMFRESVRLLLHKDIDAALDLAKSLNIELPLAALAQKTERATTGLELYESAK
jgi:3-hydroxyisobutyrate dehydrogenase